MFVYIYNNNKDTNQMNELKNLKWTPDVITNLFRNKNSSSN